MEIICCGGDNKERDSIIAKSAIDKTLEEIKHHPCGCCFCYASALLSNLQKARIDAGVHPNTGSTLQSIAKV